MLRHKSFDMQCVCHDRAPDLGVPPYSPCGDYTRKPAISLAPGQSARLVAHCVMGTLPTQQMYTQYVVHCGARTTTRSGVDSLQAWYGVCITSGRATGRDAEGRTAHGPA